MTLRSLYRIIVVSILSTLALEFAISVFCAVGRYDPTTPFDRWPGLIWPPVSLLIIILIVGMIVLWIGMLWDCTTIDKMQVWSRVLWLVLLLLTQSFGALIYYFCVYKKRGLQQT
jgi:hypothetical protein